MNEVLKLIFSGIVASLVTAFVVPWIQHRYWTRQKLPELQFAVLTDANTQMADFLVRAYSQENYVPDKETLAKWPGRPAW